VIVTIVHVGRKVGPLEKEMITALEVRDYAYQPVERAAQQSPPSHCCMFDGVQENVEYCAGGVITVVWLIQSRISIDRCSYK
jgi:hypothetical protein